MTKPVTRCLSNIDQAGDELVIYASKRPDWRLDSEAMLAYPPEDGRLRAASAPLHYLLEVALPQEAIRVWREWCGSRSPALHDKYEAVVYTPRMMRLLVWGTE